MITKALLIVAFMAVVLAVPKNAIASEVSTQRSAVIIHRPVTPPVPKSIVPSPSSTTSDSPEEGLRKPPIWDLPKRIVWGITQWFMGLMTAGARPVFRFVGNSLLVTPALTANPRVVEMWRVSVVIANAALVLFLLAGAGLITAGGGSARAQTTAKELLPRLVIAAGLINLSLLLISHLIELSNAVARAMLTGGANGSGLSGHMALTLLGAAVNPFMVLFGIAIVVLGVLVVASAIIRVVALMVLIAVAPLALVCHTLPQSERIARLWWRMTMVMLIAPVLQGLLLGMVGRVFLADHGFMGWGANGLVDLIFIGCLMYALFKVPFWMLNAVSAGAGSRAWHKTKGAAKQGVKTAAAAATGGSSAPASASGSASSARTAASAKRSGSAQGWDGEV